MELKRIQVSQRKVHSARANQGDAHLKRLGSGLLSLCFTHLAQSSLGQSLHLPIRAQSAT
eukprot:6482770-Amphidinium_carterae.1